MRLNCEDLNRIADVRVYVNDVLESSVYNNGHTIELYVPERSILLLMARKNKKREAGSGSITKRKDGRWQGQYVSGYNPETGKPRRHTITAKHRKKSQRNCVLQPPVLTTAPFRNRVKSR